MSQINSNMSGTVLRILVKVGDSIMADQDIVALESMKMEMVVPSDTSGVVKEIHVEIEEFVQEGQPLITLE